MGAYRVLDQTIPYRYSIEKINNIIFYYDHNGINVDSTDQKDGFKNNDTIALQKYPFKILYVAQGKLNIYLLNDSTHFPIHAGKQVT